MPKQPFPDEEPTQPEGQVAPCPQCRGDGKILEPVLAGGARVQTCPLCGGRCWVSKTVYSRWVGKPKTPSSRPKLPKKGR